MTGSVGGARKIPVALGGGRHHRRIADDTLHNAASFIGRKEERSILLYRSAERSAKLVLLIVGRGRVSNPLASSTLLRKNS